MSGCWLAIHIWEHYLYSEDFGFLEKNIDILKGAALFLSDWMIETHDGFFTTPLSTSPENSYRLSDGTVHALSIGCAMDIGIAAELFDDYLKATEILKINGDFERRIRHIRHRLLPYQLDNDGYLLEWNKKEYEVEPQHRHISLLFGLYPGYSINCNTPNLLDAADKVLSRRGEESTGWALGWRMCAYSRMHNGEKVKVFVDQILRLVNPNNTDKYQGGGVYPNLLVSHPPFQIDGNFAYAAGINEMLVQYENGEAIPLPALPKAWGKGGFICGLKLPGNRTVRLAWKNGLVTQFEIFNK